MEADHRFLIAITPEEISDREGDKIAALLNAGWHRVHLRHPGASRTEMRDIIERIPLELHSRLVLHGHFDLVNDFNLGGLHLNHRCPAPPTNYRGALSRSCHSVAESIEARSYAYVTLSPVLDSISKHGYHSPFSDDDFAMLDRAAIPVIALGGITPDSLPRLSRYPFSGYAMLGAIPWRGPLEEVKAFSAIVNQKLSTIC